MPDRFVFDLYAEYPDVIIDTMRRAVVQAIADVRAAAAGVDDTYFLSDLAFSLLNSVLVAADQATAERAQLRADLDALTARVTALEPPGGSPP